MDREQRTVDIIRQYYQYKKTNNPVDFIKSTCEMFDAIKTEEISDSTLDFLHFMANEVGLPQYYDLLLEKYVSANRRERGYLPLCTLGSIFFEATLFQNDQKLHKYQQEVVSKFDRGQRNRFILTAPTSFGKTYIVYQIIKKMHYRNILLIFPAISLLSENLEKIRTMKGMEGYNVHTLSEEEIDYKEKNIFIYTPERYLSFIDRHKDVGFDFTFIDEIYKIDNGFSIEEETYEENERDVAYRLALELGCKSTEDMFLAGPYLSLDRDNSFLNFTRENDFTILRYNEYEIVNKKYFLINGRGEYDVDGIKIVITGKTKTSIVAKIIEELSMNKENAIVYFGRKSDTETYAKRLIKDGFSMGLSIEHSPKYYFFLKHLISNFGEDWIIVKALKLGIGIHHGLVPKYIQKEIINLFNDGDIVVLFSTTTITEGVNTTAKNMIVMSDKKGSKPLKQFDAKNIAGRAGRFNQHFSGNVIVVENNFKKVIEDAPEELRHKNYDVNSLKHDVDYQITREKYLSEDQKKEKKHILERVAEYEIPLEIFRLFKVVGSKDKLTIYEELLQLPQFKWEQLSSFVKTLRTSQANNFDWDGFQCLLNIVNPIVSERELKGIIEHTFMARNNKEYSIAVVLLYSYLQNGFMGMLDYYVAKGETKDKAVKQVAKTVYNTFKYQLVKYLGVFDVFYRFIMSRRLGVSFDDAEGVSILLRKLEYNALSDKARKVSDYGVPFKLVKYYDTNNRDVVLDDYETYINNQIESFLK